MFFLHTHRACVSISSLSPPKSRSRCSERIPAAGSMLSRWHACLRPCVKGTLQPLLRPAVGSRSSLSTSAAYPYSDSLALYQGLQTLPLPRLQLNAVPVVHHPLYSAPQLRPGHRFPMQIFQTIHDTLISDNVIDARQVRSFQALPATPQTGAFPSDLLLSCNLPVQHGYSAQHAAPKQGPYSHFQLHWSTVWSWTSLSRHAQQATPLLQMVNRGCVNRGCRSDGATAPPRRCCSRPASRPST